ncbi:hypothetical protein FORC55_1462 [Vibrio cholerae]|nr:hypothetical protein FORC55_1462 [Vibrio cholerae]GHX38899.1 hypothetical protein VCSRO108_2158 [Vibrio cholerae]
MRNGDKNLNKQIVKQRPLFLFLTDWLRIMINICLHNTPFHDVHITSIKTVNFMNIIHLMPNIAFIDGLKTFI